MTIKQIRENERKSHMSTYAKEELYKEGTWLSKPIKTVTDLFPHFTDYTQLRVLDLGCGVGRNCISIAQHFQDISCMIDCVDILEYAIEKLNDHASQYGVSSGIRGIVSSIDEYTIAPNTYDWILAVSALEHVDSEERFLKKLSEIKNGLRGNGVVCLVINSNVREFNKASGEAVPAQFEVNMSTDILHALLEETFVGWNILKDTVKAQQYDIPRENITCELHTNVVTLVAVK